MTYELLVGSAQFWARASADIGTARRRVLVQAMTFEGDAAGRGVADAIASARAVDRRVLVDDYIRHVINDKFIVLPTTSDEIRAEAAATIAMFDDLVDEGVGVRVTNPVGWNPLDYTVRNHKKLIVADDVAYIGGINFSDHNFSWHDAMLRIADPDAVDWLVRDFAATWAGKPVPSRAKFGPLTLGSLDGRHNRQGFSAVLDAIGAAQRSVEVVSAYPTFPFIDAMGDAVARGVHVDIYTPLPNNKPNVRDYLLSAARPMGIRVRLLPEMTHVKAMLIDGETLILGSSNFDFASYAVNEEYIAVVRDLRLIRDFRAQVLEPAEAAALPDSAYHPSWLRAASGRFQMWVADATVSQLTQSRRTSVPWTGDRGPSSGFAGDRLEPRRKTIIFDSLAQDGDR